MEFNARVNDIDTEIQALFRQVYEIKGKMKGEWPAELIEYKPKEKA